jgi:hypothetical protein
VTAARGRRMARSDSTSGTTAPGQDSSRPRRGRASTPARTCSKSRNSATRKSASGLPTYGTVSLLLHGLTISPGSPTLHVLHCTVVSHQSVAMGHWRHFERRQKCPLLPRKRSNFLRYGTRR